MEEILAEGRLLKADAKKCYTLGIVYEPGVKDSQDEWANAEVIEKACWGFTQHLTGKTKQSSTVKKAVDDLIELIVKGLDGADSTTIEVSDIYEELQKAAGGLGLMHKEWSPDFGDIVENYIAPADFELDTPDGKQKIAKGTWLMGVVWSADLFKMVEDKKINGYSMGGMGKRIPDPPAAKK